MRVNLEKKSFIAAPPEDVWNLITRPEGINYELAPLMRMTVPKQLKGKTIHDVELGKRVCRSWFLLFGFLPFDYDDIVITEREHGQRFRETSSMFSIRFWEHERTLRPTEEGTELTDRVTFELRRPFSAIPGMKQLVVMVLSFLFNHRHRRLARWSAVRSARNLT
jgi:ligand-binding SRPBCC domain-containing protein